MKRTVWNGTSDELLVLVDVLARHCTCQTLIPDPTPRCTAHAMLLDQRVVDGLLFGRRIVGQLLAEEFETPASAHS